MKLAFSTLGCPDFDWKDIYSMAKDFGFSGIELRGLGNDIFSVHARPFQEEKEMIVLFSRLMEPGHYPQYLRINKKYYAYFCHL